jgi:hypothetical protein
MKVTIEIECGRTYTCHGEKYGKPFTSVQYNAKGYGGASPCDTEKDVASAVEHASKMITKAGDIPVIVDKRKKEAKNVESKEEKVVNENESASKKVI